MWSPKLENETGHTNGISVPSDPEGHHPRIAVFLLDRPDAVTQPTEEQVSSLNDPRGAI